VEGTGRGSGSVGKRVWVGRSPRLSRGFRTSVGRSLRLSRGLRASVGRSLRLSRGLCGLSRLSRRLRPTQRKLDTLMQQPDDLPQRQKLPHALPSWVRQGARHFLTLNCQHRETNSLCRGDVAAQLLKSARYYEEIGRWYLWLMLIMPDHIHLIATFDLERGLRRIMQAWKGYQKRKLHIEWQSDFFEHRLRNGDEFIEKAHYVRMNPVRKGLIHSPDAWPHILDRTDLSNVSNAIQGRAKPPAEPGLSGIVAAQPEASPYPEEKQIGQACGSAGGFASPWKRGSSHA